jgi:hypothetical protein
LKVVCLLLIGWMPTLPQKLQPFAAMFYCPKTIEKEVFENFPFWDPMSYHNFREMLCP